MSIKARVFRKSKIPQINKEYETKVNIVMGRALNLVRNDVVGGISAGGRGRVYEKYNPRRTHRASAVGDYPATDTGFLISNVVTRFARSRDSVLAFVESKAAYSSFLEFGTSKMGARPFMFPSLEKNKAKIRRMFEGIFR